MKKLNMFDNILAKKYEVYDNYRGSIFRTDKNRLCIILRSAKRKSDNRIFLLCAELLQEYAIGLSYESIILNDKEFFISATAEIFSDGKVRLTESLAVDELINTFRSGIAKNYLNDEKRLGELEDLIFRNTLGFAGRMRVNSYDLNSYIANIKANISETSVEKLKDVMRKNYVKISYYKYLGDITRELLEFAED